MGRSGKRARPKIMPTACAARKELREQILVSTKTAPT
jgi:hypothetical protein